MRLEVACRHAPGYPTLLPDKVSIVIKKDGVGPVLLVEIVLRVFPASPMDENHISWSPERGIALPDYPAARLALAAASVAASTRAFGFFAEISGLPPPVTLK